MFFIDIAVPRDVDPGVNKLDGIFLYDIDDLQSVVSSHVADRHREADVAEQIIAEEVERFTVRLHTLEVVPAIVSLQEHLETIRQAEIDRVRGRLGALSPEQELAVDALTRGIVNKIMHTPVTALKTAAREQQATTVLDVFRRMFNLQQKQPAETSPSAPASQVEYSGAQSLRGSPAVKGAPGAAENEDPIPASSASKQNRFPASNKQGRP
jgi:glutamyl-tRNA reductase